MTTRDDREWIKAAQKESRDGTCSSCGGYGAVPLQGRTETPCKRCNGTGKVVPSGRIKRVIIEYED